MKKLKKFERNSEWSGYEITKTQKGFLLTGWSKNQGEVTGYKYLHKFDGTYTPGTDLEAKITEWHTYGEYLAQTIISAYKEAKLYGQPINIVCLAKGHKVQ